MQARGSTRTSSCSRTSPTTSRARSPSLGEASLTGRSENVGEEEEGPRRLRPSDRDKDTRTRGAPSSSCSRHPSAEKPDPPADRDLAVDFSPIADHRRFGRGAGLGSGAGGVGLRRVRWPLDAERAALVRADGPRSPTAGRLASMSRLRLSFSRSEAPACPTRPTAPRSPQAFTGRFTPRHPAEALASTRVSDLVGRLGSTSSTANLPPSEGFTGATGATGARKKRPGSTCPPARSRSVQRRT